MVWIRTFCVYFHRSYRIHLCKLQTECRIGNSPVLRRSFITLSSPCCELQLICLPSWFQQCGGDCPLWGLQSSGLSCQATKAWTILNLARPPWVINCLGALCPQPHNCILCKSGNLGVVRQSQPGHSQLTTVWCQIRKGQNKLVFDFWSA